MTDLDPGGELPSGRELLCGTEKAAAPVIELRAGDLSAEFVSGDLRYVSFSGIEVVRRITVAVRDGAWNTVPAVVSDVVVQQDSQRFSVSFTARNVQGPVAFTWHGSIEGAAEGRCEFAMSGTADSDFDYRRIGICVLHPLAGFAGQPYVGVSSKGEWQGTLPRFVAPPEFEGDLYVPLVPAFEQLRLVGTELRVSFDFVGDVFEVEDQRNWTDASFKTYSRFPVPGPTAELASSGQIFSQKVSMGISEPEVPRGQPGDEPRVVVGAPLGHVLPQVGIGQASGEPTSLVGAGLLSKLALSHFRVDLHLGQSDWPHELDRGAEQSANMNCPVELAVFLSERSHPQLELLAPLLADVGVCRVLVYSEDLPVTADSDVTTARAHLDGVLPGVPFGAGTDLHFAELNQFRPESAVDLIAFPITPQVHSHDEASMVETPEAVRAVLETARTFVGGQSIAVTPVSLLPRFNPDAQEERDAGAEDLPDNVDPRQMSLFGAVWTLATMKALAEAGADSVTWFEHVGPRGLIAESSSDFRGRVHTLADQVFPVYHALRDLCEFTGSRLLECVSEDPLGVEAIALQRGEEICVLMANLQPTDQRVELQWGQLARPGQVSIRRLNLETGRGAMLNPESFRQRLDSQVATQDTLRLSLLPYEYCRLQFTADACTSPTPSSG